MEWWNFSWAMSNPKRWCCLSAALNMPANLENSAVATGLKNTSFHSNPKEGQYLRRMFKLQHKPWGHKELDTTERLNNNNLNGPGYAPSNLISPLFQMVWSIQQPLYQQGGQNHREHSPGSDILPWGDLLSFSDFRESLEMPPSDNALCFTWGTSQTSSVL